MYSTEMIKDFETKFNSAALVELLKEPVNMLLVPEIFESWRQIDEFLMAETEAYNKQFAIRKEQLIVTIPVITTARDSASSWLKLALLGLGCVAAGGYILYQFTPSAAAKRAEAKTRKIAARSKQKLVEVKAEHELALEKRRFEKLMRNGEDGSQNKAKTEIKESGNAKAETKESDNRTTLKNFARSQQYANNVIRLVIDKGD